AVRYGRDDPGEDDRPARRGERADEDLTVAKLVQLFHLAYDPGHALGDAWRDSEAAEAIVQAVGILGGQPAVDGVAVDAEQRHRDRLGDRLRRHTEGGRRVPLLQSRMDPPAPGDLGTPDVLAARGHTEGPPCLGLVQHAVHLVA